jgi:cell division protein FtsA
MAGIEQNRYVVGLDIGTTKICAIAGVRNEFGKLEIIGMGHAISEGVIRGMVTNINATEVAIRKAIQMASASHDPELVIQNVNVGIAGQHIKSSIQHGVLIRQEVESEISPKDTLQMETDMYRSVMPHGQEIIHVMPQTYAVDGEDNVMDPVGYSGVRLEADFHVITAQTNAIKNIHKSVQKAGLEIKELILEPIASSMSVLSQEEKEAGVVLVDIGGGTTDIAIFYNNILRHTAVIPFGGRIITSDIKDGCNIMEKYAEALKVQYGSSMAALVNPQSVLSIRTLKDRPPKEVSLKNLAHIIEARMTEIVEMVMMEIHHSGYADKMAAGLVVTGGGALLQNVKQFFELHSGYDTRIGFPNEHLGKCRFDMVKSPIYSTAIGLVLSGFYSIDDRKNQHAQLIETGTTARKEKQRWNFPGLNMRAISDKFKDMLTDDLDDSVHY